MNNMNTPAATSGEPLRIEYVPRPGLLSLAIVNFLLGIVTLSLYRFWAKTNIRRHIWSCVHINGHPLEYTGRGIELFKGAMIVFLVLGLPTILLISGLSIAYGPEHPAIAGVQMLLFLIVALFWGAAVYRARRYQLSRTLWRGIRGALVGSTTTYSLTYFGSLLARSMSLGWSTPVMNLNLQQQMTGDMRFGDMPFKFKGRAGPLYPSYALCWFLSLGVIVLVIAAVAVGISSFSEGAIANFFLDLASSEAEPTDSQNLAIGIMMLGLAVGFLVYMVIYPVIWSLYTARELSIFANFTSIDQARFRLDATAWSIAGLTLGNFLLAVLTLGIAAPYIQQRLVRYLCDRIIVDGTVSIDRIMQSKAPIGTAGEGLADAFDVGGL